MGGTGSGRGLRSNRFNRKWTCEESRRVDIRYYCKNMLKPGRHFPVSWTSTKSGRAGTIEINVGEEEIILIYTTTNPETGNEIDFMCSVYLDYTPCNYGGLRVWLICPKCCRRVAVIYYDIRDSYFKCRICSNLNYRSSQENNERCYSIDSKIKRIGERLKLLQSDIEELISQAYTKKKPKGMHNKTYDRLIERLKELTQERGEAHICGLLRVIKVK